MALYGIVWYSIVWYGIGWYGDQGTRVTYHRLAQQQSPT